MDQLHQFLYKQAQEIEKRLSLLENAPLQQKDVNRQQTIRKERRGMGLKNKLTCDLITDDQLAKYLQLTPRTLANYRKEGILPFTKFGGRIYYRKDDINRIFGIKKKPDQ